MIGRTNVGGGAGLNFKVVGNPQPASPKENIIWVNTNIPISSYHFGNEEPLVSDGNELILATQYDGGYGKIDGSFVEDPNYTTKVFHIPTGARKVCIRIDNYSASNAAHTFFDKDSAPVSPFPRQAGYAFIDVPDNAAYVVLALRNSETFSVTGAYAKEGMVWILTGTSSTVPFNALKKNNITVYPMSAKQYVNGAWVDKTAKSYKNGEWVEWIPEGMLYYRGNECDPVTGGWSAFVGYSRSYTLGSYTEGSDRITLKLNGDQKCVSAAPANKIDLSKASTLIVNVKRAPSEANHGLYVTPVRTVSACDRAVAKLEELKTGKNVLDVSSLSGQYYIVLNIVMWDSSTDRLEFDEVRYE